MVDEMEKGRSLRKSIQQASWIQWDKDRDVFAYQEVDNEGRDEQRSSLEETEVKGHIFVEDPSQNDNEWCDEQGDLNRAS